MAVITDTRAKNIKPEDKPIPHGGITGLSLHPSTTKGRGKWVLRYVSPLTGVRRNAGLGTYPEISISSVAKTAQIMREQIANGLDPLEERKLAIEKPEVPTFAEAANQVYNSLLPGWKNTKHSKQWIQTLATYAFPKIGHKTLDSIQPSDVAEVLKEIWLDIPETASRVKQRMHTVMTWGWANRYCTSNPVDVVNFLLPKQPGKSVRVEHQPAMPWRELPTFIGIHLNPTVFEKYDVTRSILLFIILTACRSGEARSMKWSEVDIEKAIWTVPASRMKAKQDHRVPLCENSLLILARMRGLHDELVFPSPKAQKPLSDMVLTMFLRRIKASSSSVGRFATVHGFRSSFRDWCSENSFPRDLAERALAHTVSNQVEAAYHRTDLLEQRRPMMNDWSKFLTSSLSKC